MSVHNSSSAKVIDFSCRFLNTRSDVSSHFFVFSISPFDDSCKRFSTSKIIRLFIYPSFGVCAARARANFPVLGLLSSESHSSLQFSGDIIEKFSFWVCISPVVTISS
jgi:hypothetical protein